MKVSIQSQNPNNIHSEVSPLLAPKLTLSNLPNNPSNETQLNIGVSELQSDGNSSLKSYRYKLVSGTSALCSLETNYSSVKTVNETITENLTFLSDGIFTLCVIGLDASVESPESRPEYSNITSFTWVKDTLPPSILSVSSAIPSGIFNADAIINLDIHFSEPILLPLAFSMNLDLNCNNLANAEYVGTSNSSTLNFRYQVKTSDDSTSLDYKSINSLISTGDQLKDLAGNVADLTLPIPGGGQSLVAHSNLFIDAQPPEVISVSSSQGDGLYGAGNTLLIHVDFNEPIFVTGIPTLTLNTSPARNAVFQSSALNTITFLYTVGAGDSTNDLSYFDENSLILNGGLILDSANNPAKLILPMQNSLGSLSSQKNLFIDGILPTVIDVSATTSDGHFSVGNAINLQVKFSEPVVVQEGAPLLALNTTPSKSASYSSGSGTDTLVFTYHVASGDNSPRLSNLTINDLSLNSATIKDFAINNASLILPDPSGLNSLVVHKNIIIDTVAPTVLNVNSSTPNGYYTIGSTISIQVRFSEIVTVTGAGATSLTLNTSPSRMALYSSGSGSDTLTFLYTVAASDNVGDLNYSATTALNAGGNSIFDAANNAAILTLPATNNANSLGQQKAIVIDTNPPLAPTDIAAFNPQTTTGLISNPTMAIYGVTSGYTVRLFSDSSCSSLIGSATANTGYGLVTVPAPLSLGQSEFWALTQDQAGNSSPCGGKSGIYNLKAAQVSLEKVYQRVLEPTNSVTFRVQLSAVLGSNTTVYFNTNGTNAPVDLYDLVTNQVTIPAGQTFADITFNVLENASAEGETQIQINLTGTDSTNVTVAANYNQARMYIKDNDFIYPVINKIYGGDNLTCALFSSGVAKCWGKNQQGELGNGTTNPVYSPQVIDGGALFQDLALGTSGSVICGILSSNSKLRCAGESFGTSFVDVDIGNSYVQFAANGVGSYCGITTSNDLRCWGANSSGNLGNGTNIDIITPEIIDSGIKYQFLSMNYSNTCAITTAGVLKCWGDNYIGNGSLAPSNVPVIINAGTTYTSVSVGSVHKCAITTTGILKCWGTNGNRQLGDNTTTQRLSPVTISSGTSYASVSARNIGTCGVTTGNIVTCWGSGYYNELGEVFITSPASTDPGRISVPTSANSSQGYSQVVGGSEHSCGLRLDGVVVCWGNQDLLGTGQTLTSNSPFNIDPTETFLDFDSDGSSTCAITSTGALKCWGGLLASHGNGVYSTLIQPTVIDNGTNYSKIALWLHRCGLTTLGTLKCWGVDDQFGSQGALGQGFSTIGIRATPIQTDPSRTYSKIAVGGIAGTSCAITTANKLYCWGGNLYGTVGNGNNNDQTIPVAIDASTSYIDVTIGWEHTCGLTTTGTVKCWGDNSHGQLGQGTTTGNSLVPVTVIDASSQYTKIVASYSYYANCGITQLNELKCWGSKYTLGGSSHVPLPTVMDSGTSYTDVDVSYMSICGITTSGQTKCWGEENGYIPTSINDPGGSYKKVNATSRCGITTLDKFRCWGPSSLYGSDQLNRTDLLWSEVMGLLN